MAKRDGGIEAVGSVGTRRTFRSCPHCEAPAIIRSSEPMTLTVKHLRMMCTNTDCGFTWVDQISPVHALCPSQVPNPEVSIPPCPTEYLRRHYRNTGPPDDPDQLLMFPDEPPGQSEAA